MGTSIDGRIETLIRKMDAERPALMELSETLPILIAAMAQVTARLDIHDEIIRLCMEDGRQNAA